MNQATQPRAGGYTVPCIICGTPVPLPSEADLFELAQDVQAAPRAGVRRLQGRCGKSQSAIGGIQ